jgi:hypothetical protein
MLFLTRKQKYKISMVNLTAYIFNIISTGKSALLSPIKSMITTPPPSPHFTQNQGIECMPIVRLEKGKNICIRFSKGTSDATSIQYAAGHVKWQKYDFMMDDNRINILNTIYEKEGMWVVECSLKHTRRIFCMKLRTSLSEYENESRKFIEMADTPIENCFPDVFAFIKIQMINCRDNKNKVWYGICMEKMSHTVAGLIFPGRKTIFESLLKELNSRFSKEVNILPCDEIDTTAGDNILGGVLLNRVSTSQTFQTSLIVACIRLLTKLHKEGFVHGDTHLGNFVLNKDTWRVYVIDVERSFRSDDPVQHFLDIQELFGHATGLIISRSNRMKWDFNDILGVACKLHPSISRDIFNSGMRSDDDTKKASAFAMLPVCHCFSRTTPEERKMGCSYCLSDVNEMTSLDFYKRIDDYIKSFVNMSLKMIKHCTKIVRENSDDQHSKVLYCLLSPQCSKTIAPLLIEQKGIYIDKMGVDEQTQSQFHEWVDDLLYQGAFNYNGKITTNIWLSILRYHRHHTAVTAILECCYKYIHISENIQDLISLSFLKNEMQRSSEVQNRHVQPLLIEI